MTICIKRIKNVRMEMMTYSPNKIIFFSVILSFVNGRKYSPSTIMMYSLVILVQLVSLETKKMRQLFFFPFYFFYFVYFDSKDVKLIRNAQV